MSKGSVTQISLKANEELIKRTKQRPNRSFYMLGKESWKNSARANEKAEWCYEGIDFIDEIVAMTNNERIVIKILKDNIRWDKEHNTYMYIVLMEPDAMYFVKDDANYLMTYATFLKGYQLLFKKDLVRRVSKHRYMMNPEFFIVNGEQSLHFELAWSNAKSFSKPTKTKIDIKELNSADNEDFSDEDITEEMKADINGLFYEEE